MIDLGNHGQALNVGLAKTREYLKGTSTPIKESL